MWTKETPTESGCYVFNGHKDGYDKPRTYLAAGFVENGRWIHAENPEWLYFNGELITNLVGEWYRLESLPPDQYGLVLSIDSGKVFDWIPASKDK